MLLIKLQFSYIYKKKTTAIIEIEMSLQKPMISEWQSMLHDNDNFVLIGH